jgi:hypothetical protein
MPVFTSTGGVVVVVVVDVDVAVVEVVVEVAVVVIVWVVLAVVVDGDNVTTPAVLPSSGTIGITVSISFNTDSIVVVGSVISLVISGAITD